MGRRQPPPCPLRNRWAQPERSGMSQPPCQGQPWVWLSLTLSPGAPWAPGAEVLWSFSVPGCWTLPPGASREEDLGPAPPLRQLPAARRARYVEQKSAAQGSGPRVRPGPGAAPAPGSPAPTLCIPRAVPARRRTPPPPVSPPEASVSLGTRMETVNELRHGEHPAPGPPCVRNGVGDRGGAEKVGDVVAGRQAVFTTPLLLLMLLWATHWPY